jgi:hypothetical protein
VNEAGTATLLTASGAAAWQEAYGLTSGAHIPDAKFIASHNERLWVGHTVEDAVTHRNRVRFSHPLNVENWRSLDYIDLEPGWGGEELTGMVAYTDHILVFKDRAVYAIYGFDPDSYQVVTVSREVGCVSQEAMVATPWGVAFWDRRKGLQIWDGQGVNDVSSNIRPLLDEGDIPEHYSSLTNVGFIRDRIWCGVAVNHTAVNYSLVFDPKVGKGGAWMMYDIPLGPSAAMTDTATPENWIWVTSATNTFQLQTLENDNDDLDDYGIAKSTWGVPRSWPTVYEWATPDNADTEYHIYSYYRTAWIDPSNSVIQKRWKRPQFVLIGDNLTYQFLVKLYKDYDPQSVNKQFYMTSGQNNPAAVWDTSVWDVDVWDSLDGRYDDIEDGSALGLARAIQMQFMGPAADTMWGVNQVTFRYLPKRIR